MTSKAWTVIGAAIGAIFTTFQLGGFSEKKGRSEPKWTKFSIVNEKENSRLPNTTVDHKLTPTLSQCTSQISAAGATEVTPACLTAGSLGLPSDNTVRCYGGYLSSLNYERRIPNWIVEVLDYQHLKRNVSVDTDTQKNDRFANAANASNPSSLTIESEAQRASRMNSSFYSDSTVDKMFRVEPETYADSQCWGISRGHLAAAQFHLASQAEVDATFNMNANIVPQDMTMNAVDWYRLESLTRRLAKDIQHGMSTAPVGKWTDGQAKKQRMRRPYVDANAKLYVATGPAFVPTRDKEGKLKMEYEVLESKKKKSSQIVAVPTHLFKVIVAERRESPTSSPHYTAAAFLIPNTAIPDERPLESFKLPISTLEFLTGLKFFPGVKASNLPDLCQSYRCEAKGSPLFNGKYRSIAQLRTAESVPQLRSRYHSIVDNLKSKNGDTASIDSAIETEYKKRLDVLLSQATQSIESV